ncbi:MAG: HAD superfamily hydrolase (TIGR01509 family) [Arcticibacterium sp.]|jgi:HAD superfamily hydrolase (TIGR01509 family)
MADHKAILFDFGNVVINIDPELTIKALSEISNKPLERVREKMEMSQLNKRYEMGLFTDDEFREIVRQTIGYPFSDAEVDKAWNALLLDLPPHRIKLILELQSSYPVYLLSNTNNIHITRCNRIFREEFGIPDVKTLFKRAFYSYEMGLWKPDPKIYQEVLDEIEQKAEDVLFIDDNASNIASAAKMGFQTVLMDPHNDDIANHFQI